MSLELEDMLSDAKLDMTNVNLKISHLSESDIKALIIEYYEGKLVSQLLVDYSISARTSELIKLFPRMILENMPCKYCSSRMTAFLPSKTSSLRILPECIVCKHSEAFNCTCLQCVREREIKHKREKILKKAVVDLEYAIHNYGPIKKPNELSLKEAVYLLIFYRYCTTEDVLVGNLRNIVDVPLTPAGEEDLAIIKLLLESGLLAISPDSDLRAFGFTDGGDSIDGYYPNSVDYRLILGETPEEINNYIKILEDLIRSKKWPELWNKQIEELQFELAMSECFEYLIYQAGEHKLIATRGDKTKLMLSNLLQDFSASQIFGIIYRAVQSAVSFQVKENISRKQAANSIVGSCQRYADRARAEQWDLKTFGRDYKKCSRSALSYVLYNVFLQNGLDSIHANIPKLEPCHHC